MKIDIPKVIVLVELAAYAPELAGKFLHVWVNPPREKLQEYDDLVTQLQEQEVKRAQEQLFPTQVDKETSGLQKSFNVALHWLKIKKDASRKDERLDEHMLRWYAEIWSQGPEDAQWTLEELRTLEAQDPTFMSWMISETWKARTEHMQRKKKV